jgi:uncharacterized integral membrane protein (TIGR00698 family)
VPVVSALLIAITLGIVVGSLRVTPEWAKAGISWSSRRLLRIGIVLLGLQLSLTSLGELGFGGVAVLLVTVAGTFLGTLAIGRLMRVELVTRYLIATGFAICGASAVVAMSSVVDPDNESEEEVAQAVALVTLYGTIALFAIPALAHVIGLSELEAGLWVGASIHEVAQVVAAGSAISASALAIATVAKLGRVVLLAPLVAATGLRESLLRRRAEAARSAASAARPPIVPLFVLGFLGCVALRTFLPIPAEVLSVTTPLTTLLLAISMFGLGTGVDIRKVVRTGARPAALGAASTVLAAALSLAAILTVRGLF